MSEDRRWIPKEFDSFRGLPWKKDAQDARELLVEQQLRPLPEHASEEDSARSPQSEVEHPENNLGMSRYSKVISSHMVNPDIRLLKARWY